jgi:hypothetical protein
MTRSAPPTSSSTHTMESQTGFGSSTDVQIQMIQKFSQQSGMTIEYSKLLVFSFMFKCISSICFNYSCLTENDWNYDKAGQKFQECHKLVCFHLTFVLVIFSLFPI